MPSPPSCSAPTPIPHPAQALAIAIHNFPEGLATFLATVADTEVGLKHTQAIKHTTTRAHPTSSETATADAAPQQRTPAV